MSVAYHRRMEYPVSLLAHVVVAARSALLDMDARDVPQNLHKIALQTGKKLPPPMARRVLAELDMNEWLRGKVLDHIEEHGKALDEPSEMFLRRPDGWEDALEERVAAAEASSEQSEIDELRARVLALEKELDAARGKMKRAQREAEMARVESERRATAARSASRSAQAREELEVSRRENAAMSQRLAEMARDLEESQGKLKRVRAELLKERRADRPPDRPPERSAWAELDALGAARLLDEVSVAFAPTHEFEEPTLPLVDAVSLELPAGVSPDEGAAISWLADSPGPYVLLVDGYNVTFLLDPDGFTKAERRDHLTRELARFRKVAVSAPRVVVVFDSDQPGGVTLEPGPGGVEVVFTTAGHSADDEVLVRATELGERAVVVSTDRRVREGAQAVGALGLWSQALVGWMRS